MIKLSILIPSLVSRSESYLHLKKELYRQIDEMDASKEVEVLANIDSGEKSIGTKRNELLQCSMGKYVCFVDDDDIIVSNYIQLLLQAINEDKDCCSLKGVITWDNENPEIFEHSIKYDEYRTNATGNPKYERYPNHLNAIKREIAIGFKFPETNFGEDTDWATQIKRSGLIKTEAVIPQVIYHYQFKTSK
jgi:glycosyltransferase involved in cell wall biosynthesis